MKYTIIAVALVVVLGIGYYVMTSGSSGTPTYTAPTTDNSAAVTPTPLAPAQTTPTPAPTATSPVTKTPEAPAQTSVNVSIKNFAFNPSSLSVKVGTKVTWTNSDTVPHTVTSDSGSLLKSSTLSPGQSFSFTFTSPGSDSYHCAIHSMMKGTITVTN